MTRGLVVAGPRPSQGNAAQIKNADVEDVSRNCSHGWLLGWGLRRLTHRNPDLRVRSIDQRGESLPAVHRTEIDRQSSPPKAVIEPCRQPSRAGRHPEASRGRLRFNRVTGPRWQLPDNSV